MVQLPCPVKRVLPVALDEIKIANLPNYLKATTVLTISGNAAAEVRTAVENMFLELRRSATRPWKAAALATIVLAPALFYVLSGRTNTGINNTQIININRTTHSVAATSAPILQEFEGTWECIAFHIQDSNGNKLFYQPIRITIDKNGNLSGKATVVIKVTNGISEQIIPPLVYAITGKIKSPQNKTYESLTTPIGKIGGSYRAAEIIFQVADGSEGSGFISFTENLPVVEYIKIINREMMGRMFAQKI